MQYPNHVSSATWIIPARAGFTPGRHVPDDRPPDHPRSRGVYSTRRSTRSTTRGSSPLARGLLPKSPRSDPQHQDHPRSRGVYVSRTSSKGGWPGSSPLARGLPFGMRTAPSSAGIIPARAGFTASQHSQTPSVWDHPRSRGVYTHSDPNPALYGGSSPLARGLHARVRVCVRIPMGSSPLARGLPAPLGG